MVQAEPEPQSIGVPAESTAGETRVAATPVTVKRLVALGYGVVVEPGAGASSRFSDAAYEEAGARLGDPWAAEIVLKVNGPSTEEVGRLRDGATLVALISPALNPDLVEDLARRPITVLAMDAVPRISRAQSLDVLSSMANIAGYRAVVEAAHAFGRFFTGQVTAAGKVPPAKVLVAGAGVAGLAAIGAARSLGAVVRATDPRPEVAEQVRSLGGEFLTVSAAQEVSTDGYARATSDDYDRLAERLYAEQAADVDIIITTALIPGRPAPRLITAEDVARMKPGSVIVDMAAAQGGNVEGTVAGKAVVTDNDVTIIGYTDLPGRLPAQASQLYGTNLVNLMKLLTPGEDGRLVLDFDDAVQRSMTVVRDGAKTWPPPPVKVTAAPAPDGAPEPATPTSSETAAKPARPARSAYVLVGAGALALFLVTAFSPGELIGHFTVFVLAIVIGFYVIGQVHHALHTPLMSVTNAISGIVVVGALLQIGHGNAAVTVLSFAAILLASINIFGGFAVTRRMLGMFSKG
ncbi:Re/Si-specific NAD(P)(+) transhydrogenase subunit alpha [Streptomyces europaeiscabiei]|uniref:proton-translocating NAD(P)(+) transhydrogenase n=1 Tax=Streptomyces europaeiscabiei TaxID=146819 RepID=A0ABU4NL57_9ACTN|nr:Re/Si-specific NAD(P)(+) transhydrogenase subunit alpha [Streptomyces europaeiscabiei]MDX2524462.1 Re/Si-specific NAD(P)(+) transhydrogenase subunit alpha [Streptomyces europaeiscabiei]MDX2757057.1 Re/Si-specific NAD(P)(+) transhydrogenase subunit alpha [Streptomyces europaeiscabiei]MDX2767646.1 Re/Si-specific NAD(P)(+) transhydrogenase subunit alpha [Streptomyces europaeiscabiei]MDX3545726.1 Re/Si-specific NAD(P)(+) transhydrogenase subunit alpha [Streptomyces europaeiscabiei]MDX3554876.1 